jgi:hypothetical protein
MAITALHVDGTIHLTYSYKLRSGGAVPYRAGFFIAQTFGAERSAVYTCEATTTLPESDDFMGASIGAPYAQASFQRLPYLSQDGRQIFSGTIIGRPLFIDENQIPGI